MQMSIARKLRGGAFRLSRRPLARRFDHIQQLLLAVRAHLLVDVPRMRCHGPA